MPKKQRKKVESYRHAGEKRANNPPVGLVTPQTDPDAGQKRTWAYDPHIGPALQWTGKAERTSFAVPTVSLHVHERIEARTIIEAVRKTNGETNGVQTPLFASSEQNPPLREAVEFYKHRHNWSNRLIAGDSLLVMNSLLEKEGMGGKVQCVYMDPPYGIKYGGNFQPFVGKRDVKDGKDDDLTAEPEMIRAFRDTWELGIHSYLSYMRDRLLLARELLNDSGSCFVQISDENVHLVRNLMDEVFGAGNFVNQIGFRTAMTKPTNLLNNIFDYILWYAKDKTKLKFRALFAPREFDDENDIIGTQQIEASAPQAKYSFEYQGMKYNPKNGWRVSKESLQKLAEAGRLHASGSLRFIRYVKDFPFVQMDNMWAQQMSEQSKIYAVQTSDKVIHRCILMTTDPGDLVFDPTCGSGTTAFVAEQWGRRWLTCDTSRVAVTLAKQRLMTAVFDYYKLAHPDQGVGSGFQYKTVPHITLKSIANDEPPATETLYDQPLKDSGKARVTGPFTVEAVPAPRVKSIAEPEVAPADEPAPVDNSIAREGETLRQEEWRDELEKSGVRGRGGQRIAFSRVELFPGRHLHATAETRPDDSGANQTREAATAYNPQHAVICFGPEHAPLEQRMVERAWEESRTLSPKPEILIFAAFQFDPEAAKDIDELSPSMAGMQLLKVQMNADMQTADLRKKQRGDDSFWLVGQPDVVLYQIRKGPNTGKWRAEVRGFDYFDTRSGELLSGGGERIAMWMLDTDYDGRSLYPRQVFFPMAGEKDGWSRLARNLRAEVDEDLIEAYRGVESLPFEAGKHRRVAVKIIDDRGVESLRVLEVE
ncbi:MAG: site-specific DNA-methyltransferase [Gammaproteobacteria bacterium]|nr:site-specific DNA-methyltransferase [Gammaproteobacteria bacterium]